MTVRKSKKSLKKPLDKLNKGHTKWTHLVLILFCQFTQSQPVKDISNGLRSSIDKLKYREGIQTTTSKSSVS
ncbi:DUF4372 domain-containing protein [Sphingobacterium sp. JB170]|uniref:DUF4372 domain-containing protein n=1 Tax=Sphingobacterium sp. JB170 TaxID=1434842 RepID=UPI0015C5BA82